MSANEKTNSFGRRTWNREEYLERARQRYLSSKGEGNKDEQQGSKLSRHEFHKDRENQLQKIDEMNTLSFVSEQQSAISGKRGRGIGFYCEICNLTYKNDLELVDHLNSKQHFQNAGVEYIDSREITLELVKDRLEKLAEERDRALMLLEDDGGALGSFNLKQRIELRRQFEKKLSEKRRLKKAARKNRVNERKVRAEEKKGEGESDMMKMMGFKGFESTKQ